MEYFEGKVKNVLRTSDIKDSDKLGTEVIDSLENGDLTKQIETESFFRIPRDKITFNLPQKDNPLVLNFESLGSKEGKTTTLHTTMTIPIKKGSNSSVELPDFNSIPIPQNVRKECKNPTFIDNACKEILIIGSGSYAQNHNNLDGKRIYTTGALALDGNANSMTDTEIHTDGSMSLGKNMNNASKVILEVKGATAFGGQLRLDSSTVLIGGSMSVDGHMDLDKTTVYVGGSASVSKHLSISSDSKMCVAGDLEANQIEIGGKLFIKGTVRGKIKAGQPTYVDDTNFIEKCGVRSTSQTLTILWNDISTDVDYR
ncbi:hypothetical protein N5C46_17045 [Rossellomorea vietnamensis]|uniref:Uncharacterized protein n=1 Tax=Rossellomorea vietnamensis TaxID=218284 RepID=A0ACD4C3Z0_9BACI|nr:hypothetical protein [Rossellomorea vietnamensis]UXH43356.1 hypothetical protein N5C46_17045 [Rossellomorea vietnamensis]